ncbi:UDP-N-acetylmuramoyl-tripeptide--D-alanyl-D-alanine ligase [Christensenellaceae bacterium OttesenSCG-928-M15]|nr:UDP-N-acetylmuramoyl-tripeptide--D-alanyl-D-alanine ligase [Christensenellaceae bacterium OttesenSCG-928-M15]
MANFVPFCGLFCAATENGEEYIRMLWDLIFSILAGVITVFASLRFIHMLQLESYQGKMYLKWLKRAGRAPALNCLLGALAAFFLRSSWTFFYNDNQFLLYVADALYLFAMASFVFSSKKQEEKKKLVFTGRANRLLAILFLLCLVFHRNLFIPLFEIDMPALLRMPVLALLRYLPGMLLPFFVLLAYLIALPIENGVKRYYFNDAKKKLAQRKDVIKIGITGSFGKTSTKFILGTILQEKYNTLITPSSFNTPMGVTRVVREQLKDEHEVFVAEMGARYKGDIKELCELVAPGLGLITSVGKQHLETFGSYEAVIETKSELLHALPESGTAFVNGDNKDCRENMRHIAVHTNLFGIEDDESYYMRASDIKITPMGSEFTLITATGESIRCATALLGEHNILNITGAAALAYYIGVPLHSIAEGILKVKPVEHRLQLIQGPVTVIDDAFNANPVGTKAALKVLGAFENPNKVIVTPGMVELGAEQDALNEEFGRMMAKVATTVILVGKYNEPAIRRGLLAEGYKEEQIVFIETLSEVQSILPRYAPAGSVVLFENDLPDNYA